MDKTKEILYQISDLIRDPKLSSDERLYLLGFRDGIEQGMALDKDYAIPDMIRLIAEAKKHEGLLECLNYAF